MNSQIILIFAAMAAIFYLLILRPQQRAKRAKQQMAAELREGAEILTDGGIFGTIAALRDDDFDLEIADGVVLRMDRRAIATVIPATDEDGEDDDAPDAEDDASVDDGADDGTSGAADGETPAS